MNDFKLTVPNLHWHQRIYQEQKKLLPVGLDLMQEIMTGLSAQYLTNCAKLTF